MRTKIISKRELSRGTFILRFERHKLKFTAGQHIMVAPAGNNESREYSIYSGEQDEYLEILVREVHEGNISTALHKLNPGDHLQVGEPVGYFTLPEEQHSSTPLMLLATGTGIAPFHSYVRSYPKLNYTLIHGIRYADEAYEKEQYLADRHIVCTSREKENHFRGRITDYLEQHNINTQAHFYLCGNIRMIHDAFDILQQKGVQPENLHAEVYF